MKKILIRSILVFIIGIVISLILYSGFFISGSKADIFEWWTIIAIYLLLLLLNIVLESAFYYLFNKNILKAYWYSFILLFLFVLLGYVRSNDKSDYQYSIYAPTFFILDLLIYFIQEKVKKKVGR